MPPTIETTEAAPAEDGEEGAHKEDDSMEGRQARYQQQLKQLDVDNAQSEDKFVELEIKAKIREQRDGAESQRISQELLSEAFRWRLSKNDCQNRGYVLDGYPCSYSTAN